MKAYTALTLLLLVASCGILNPSTYNVSISVVSSQNDDTYVLTIKDDFNDVIYGPSYFKKGDKASLSLDEGNKSFYVEGYRSSVLRDEGGVTVYIDTSKQNEATIVLTPVFSGTDTVSTPGAKTTSTDTIHAVIGSTVTSGSIAASAAQGYRYYKILIDGANSSSKRGIALTEAHFSITGIDSFYPNRNNFTDIVNDGYYDGTYPTKRAYTWPPYALFDGDSTTGLLSGGVKDDRYVVIDSVPWQIILDIGASSTHRNKFDSFYVCCYDTVNYTTPSSIKIYGTNDVVTETNYYNPYQVRWHQIASAVFPASYISATIPLYY